MYQRRQLFPSLLKPRKQRAGFTLIELMVVCSLLGLISAVLIGLLSQSSALVSQGTAVIGLNQKARTAVDKMAPYIVTAVQENGSPALVSPNAASPAPTLEDLISYESIKFTTTEDFLDPNYDARATWIPGTAPFFYEIYFDDETNPTPYELADGTPIDLGQILIRRYTSASFTNVDNTVAPQPIAHNVQYFRCHVLGSQNLEVIVHTVGKRKGPAGNMIDVFEEAQGILNIPSPSYL